MKPLVPTQQQSLFEICPACKGRLSLEQLISNAWVCPRKTCEHHLLINAEQRLGLLVEPGGFTPWDADLIAQDPLNFPGYPEKLEQIMSNTGLTSAAVTGLAKIGEFEVAIGITDYSFMVGAMNTVVGEKLARCIDRAVNQRLPLFLVSGSGGGAMMYEGLLSLMQMPIVTGALSRHKQAGLPSICLLTQSTFGGVTASWASLAQITLTEPKADIGFVGNRVSGGGFFEATPLHFRKAEYQFERGAVDEIVSRTKLKQTLLSILRCSPIREDGPWKEGRRVSEEIRSGLPKADEHFLHDQSGIDRIIPNSAMDHVSLARHPQRPYTLDYLQLIFERFFELHGDRHLKDDGAIVGGLAVLEGLPVVVVGHQKNRTMKEKDLRNYGMAGPAGYRKALRLMDLAEQRHYPLVCLIDTPGADASAASEGHGISYVLAKCQERCLNLNVPIVSIITGEGGSGGAVALAVADRVLMMEYAIYSVIRPEEAANIIWKDKSRAAEAAEKLRITAKAALDLKIVDHIVSEPPAGAHDDFGLTAQILKAEIADSLFQLCGRENLIEQRYQRLRRVNSFLGP